MSYFLPRRQNIWYAIAAQITVTILIMALVGIRGWDDGAITLAYSKTFAETGRIALTAASEQVEGFSSISWFLINAFVALFRPSFSAAILTSQALSGLFFCVSTYYLWRISCELGLYHRKIPLLLFTYAFFGPSISEIANGMEMPLLTCLGLSLVYYIYYGDNKIYPYIISALFLLTRFEAMIYYAFILLPLLFHRRLREFVCLGLFGVCVVLSEEAIRFLVFSEWLPNTIYAKMNIPYRQVGLAAFVGRIEAGLEVALVAPLVVASIAGLLILKERPTGGTPWRSRELLILGAPIVGIVVFNFLIGTNWGYLGRMQTMAFPFLFLLLCFIVEKFNIEPNVRFWPYALLFSLLTVSISVHQSAVEPFTRAYESLFKNNVRDDEFGVTPASYRLTGLAVERIRELLGRDSIVFLTPDIGGLGLCCSNIRVIDLGLLANRFLAKNGYGALGEVIETERPDVIEAHQIWASNPKLYELPEFQNDYIPAIVKNTRLYVSKRISDRILENKTGEPCEYTRESCLLDALKLHRYAPHETRVDDDAFLKMGYYIKIN